MSAVEVDAITSPREDIEPPVVAPGEEVVPGYEVVAHLRRGRRLDVYDVWSTHRAARCVVKVVRPDRLDERHPPNRLRYEGRVLRDLAHPHLVRVYEVLEEPQVAVVMETLTGPTVEDLLDRNGRLDPFDVARLAAQAAAGLHYLHQHGCVHADVTAGNLVLEAGMVKILDLSLAGPVGRIPRSCGTAGYQAPEQLLGGRRTPATDAWGLGTVIGAALLGRTPGSRLALPGRVLSAARERTTRGSGARGLLRTRLLDLTDQCRRPEPGDRITFEEMLTTLGALIDLRET